jgi:hypothetical protein
MKATINMKIRKIVERGSYYVRPYNESDSAMQSNMKILEYHYCITTADNVLHFVHKTGSFDIPLKDFDWHILWDKLGNVPIDDNDEIEEAFEHFSIGTEKTEIWHWFEWFFNIQLGGNVL